MMEMFPMFGLKEARILSLRGNIMFKGSIVALVTPFTNGKIDEDQFQQLKPPVSNAIWQSAGK